MKKKYSIFFVVMACLSMGSTCHKPFKLITPKQYSVPPHIPDELIVWRGNENTKKFLLQRIRSTARVDNDTIHVDTCRSCDDQLERWKGEAIKTFVQTEVARGSSGGSTRGVGDEKDSLFYSLNFIIKSPEPEPYMAKYDTVVYSLQPAGSRVLVAVFDTGIDTAKIKVAGSPNGCKTDGKYGWNFVDKSSDVSDDNGHGTLVSQFMINQAKANVNILPVKVLGANGEGDLFKFLCGIAYAKRSGASVFNASLGFYYYNPEPPILLKNYLLNYIANGQNKMICAAGNIDSSSDSIMRVMYGNGFPDSLLRNIDIHYFYPASFSGVIPNLISVTTVGRGDRGRIQVSPRQNYSRSKVNFGVQADNWFDFRYPVSEEGGVSGSSYATAIFTGIYIRDGYHPESTVNTGLRTRIEGGKYLER